MTRFSGPFRAVSFVRGGGVISTKIGLGNASLRTYLSFSGDGKRPIVTGIKLSVIDRGGTHRGLRARIVNFSFSTIHDTTHST